MIGKTGRGKKGPWRAECRVLTFSAQCGCISFRQKLDCMMAPSQSSYSSLSWKELS